MKFYSCVAVLFLLAAGEVHATTVFGGTLLTQANALQIESWLGESNLAFTNIFGAPDSSTLAADFHLAADGKGRTITVYEVTPTGFSSPILIGGYDPVSWDGSLGNYITNPTDPGRTAFIFNLTTTTVQRQNLVAQGSPGSGQYQTYDTTASGPTFGGGWDIGVYVGGAYLFNYSYGGTSFATDIAGVPNVSGGDQMTVQRIETFTLAADTAVPEPATVWTVFAALSIGLSGFAKRGFARRKV